jgi:hypothetical protein
MPDDGLDDPAPRKRPAVSRLAVASALMGGVSIPLVCCSLGVSGALAVALGMVALGRIRASGGALGGRGFAWAGIASGTTTVVLSLVLVSFVTSLQKDWDAQLDEGVRRTFAASDDGSARLALQSWSAASSASVSSAEIGSFAATARERFGAYRSMGLVSRNAAPTLLGDQMITHVVSLEFEGGTRSGVVVSRLRTSADAMTPTLYLSSILVNDEESRGGALRFPPGDGGVVPSGSVPSGSVPSGQAPNQDPSEQDADPAATVRPTEGVAGP